MVPRIIYDNIIETVKKRLIYFVDYKSAKRPVTDVSLIDSDSDGDVKQVVNKESKKVK